LELNPSFYAAYLALGSAYEQKTAFSEAIAAVQAGAAAWHSGMDRSFLGHIYALMGRKAEAREVAIELAQLSPRRYVSPAQIAVIYAALGENDRALDRLEKAYQQRSAAPAYLQVNPRSIPGTTACGPSPGSSLCSTESTCNSREKEESQHRVTSLQRFRKPALAPWAAC